MPQPRRAFSSDFRRFFLRGLAVLLPSVLTLWLIVYAYQFIDGVIAAPINGWVRTGLVWSAEYITPLRDLFGPDPATLEAELATRSSGLGPAPSAAAVAFELRQRTVDAWWAARWWTNLIGVGVAIIAVYLAGRLVGGFVGRSIYASIERIFVSIPLVRAVYPSVKQVVDFLFSEEKTLRFNRVVAVEYPRKGIWSLGLVTGERRRPIVPGVEDSVTVFVPSSPTPFTGYTVVVPRKELLEVPITIDQAIRFLVSGGVLGPDAAGSGQARIVQPASPSATDPTAAPAGSEAAREPAEGSATSRTS